MRTAVEEYLKLRRSLGFGLVNQARLLRDFAAYLDATGTDIVTTTAAVAWARQPVDADATWLHARLGVVRGFAIHQQALEPATEVPPANLLPDGNHRATPFIYTEQEIAELLQAAGRLPTPIRAATYQTLIGLLTVTGMRIGEATALDRDDVDWEQGLLTIRHGKRGSSRQLPLHRSTVTALQHYAQRRDAAGLEAKTSSFFISTTGTRLIPSNATTVFGTLCREVGLESRSPRCRPRLHDLRHTAAVNALLQWYRDGVDVAPRLPLLSTFLGHSNPAATYWYLTGTPELLGLAADRLESIPGARP
nr:tyrosine-type recombinase/integrase [Brevibacterium sp. Mu109]